MTAVLLHVGSGSELSLGAYLYRVLFHLVVVGALGLLVRWMLGFESVVRSR